MIKPLIDFQDYTVVLLAGGQGTRIQSISAGLPKTLIPVCGKPVLFHAFDILARSRFAQIVVLAGYQGHLVQEAVASSSYARDLPVRVLVEDVPLGTGGCLSLLQGVLKTPYCIVISGDLMFDVDLQSLCLFHAQHNADCTLTVHANRHPHDADLVLYDSATYRVSSLVLRPHPPGVSYPNVVNAAISVLNSDLLQNLVAGVSCHFEQDFITLLLAKNYKICARPTTEYIADMGTPERYEQVQRDVAAGLPREQRLGARPLVGQLCGGRHMGIPVTNLEPLLDFYQGLLGFTVHSLEVEEGPFVETILGVPAARIRIAKLKAPDGWMLELLEYQNQDMLREKRARRIQDVGLAHLALTVLDLDAVVAVLRDSRVPFISDPCVSPSGKARVCFCQDPEDNYIELVQVLP